MPKLQWVDHIADSKLFSQGVFLSIWHDRGRWYCATGASWPTREEGKAALVKALRDQYTELLASLPEDPEDFPREAA